jgi:AbrB family looped-hinge helix DNA binding protein
MQTTRLSSKGQVVVPKSIRDEHDWRPGTEFIVESTRDGILLRPAKPRPASILAELAGSLGYRGPAKTIEEMEAGIDAEIAARRDRGRY